MFPEIFQLQKPSFFRKRYALLIVFYCWQILPIVLVSEVEGVYAARGTTRFLEELSMISSMVFVTLLAPLANAIVNDLLAKFNWKGVTVTAWHILKKQFQILVYNVTVNCPEAKRKMDCTKENWQTVLLQFILFTGMLVIFLFWMVLVVSFYLFVGWLVVAIFESVRLIRDSNVFNEP